MCSSSALNRVKRLRLSSSFRGSAQAGRCDQVIVGPLRSHRGLVVAEDSEKRKKAEPSGSQKFKNPSIKALTIRSAVCPASPGVRGYIPIDHIRHVAAFAQELHHFLIRTRHLRPPGFRFRVLLKSSNLLPIKHKVHMTQTSLRSSSSGVAPLA